MRENALKQKLAQGETAFGTMVFEMTSPGLPQILSSSGAEFVLYDMEHSGLSYETLKLQVALSRGLPITPLVRVPSGDYQFISRALDQGAQGIMVPMIETAKAAEAFVAATRYPTLGVRGAAFGISHDDYIQDPVREKMEIANARCLNIALVETPRGIENVEEIAAVDGIDAIWFGHFDLSSFLGIPGQFGHAEMAAALEQAKAACRKHGKVLSGLVNDAETGQRWMENGFRLLAYSTDIWLLQNALRSGIEQLKASVRSI
ncbi:MAG: aldolase/citrate lyase family protein [Rhodovibrionaceae bacterium]